MPASILGKLHSKLHFFGGMGECSDGNLKYKRSLCSRRQENVVLSDLNCAQTNVSSQSASIYREQHCKFFPLAVGV